MVNNNVKPLSSNTIKDKKISRLKIDYSGGFFMLILTTPTIEGKKINEYYGLVTGESLLGANVYKDLFSGVRDVVGGRTSAYEEELKKAREVALNSMKDKAANKGANAVIGTRVAYHNLGGTMGNTIMVTVFGTAISYQE
jgi:uncharacterized protein YbjQ (UPF0145 family)